MLLTDATIGQHVHHIQRHWTHTYASSNANAYNVHPRQRHWTYTYTSSKATTYNIHPRQRHWTHTYTSSKSVVDGRGAVAADNISTCASKPMSSTASFSVCGVSPCDYSPAPHTPAFTSRYDNREVANSTTFPAAFMICTCGRLHTHCTRLRPRTHAHAPTPGPDTARVLPHRRGIEFNHGFLLGQRHVDGPHRCARANAVLD